MTQRPDDDLLLGHGTGPSPDEPAQADEDPELQANRTDVEDSPTGHS